MTSSPASRTRRRSSAEPTAGPRDDAQRRSADQDDLTSIGRSAAGCRACPLWKGATRTVLGEGPADADLVLVGEQPGDKEDLAGRPFVGPAGQLLDRALAEAGIDREGVYVTNAVKHFKNEPRGKRRLHKRPDAGEVQACRWWLSRELALVRPRLVVAMGATAALAIFGRATAIARNRGRAMETTEGLRAVVTVHPSFLLRVPDAAAKAAAYDRFVADLRQVAALRRAA